MKQERIAETTCMKVQDRGVKLHERVARHKQEEYNDESYLVYGGVSREARYNVEPRVVSPNTVTKVKSCSVWYTHQ